MCLLKSCCGIPLKPANVIILCITLVAQFGIFAYVTGINGEAPSIGRVVIFLMLICSGFIGVFFEKPDWLWRYMVVHIAYIVICIGIGIWILLDPSSVSRVSHDFNSVLEAQLCLAFVVFVIAGVYIYFLNVIASFYKKLKTKEAAEKAAKEVEERL